MLWLLSLIEKNDVFFVLVTFLDRALRIIIHLARNAEKGGGVLMSITVPKLKHSFIFQVPDPDPVFRVPYAPPKRQAEARRSRVNTTS